MRKDKPMLYLAAGALLALGCLAGCSGALPDAHAPLQSAPFPAPAAPGIK